jgi:spectinomycin phosphotransferase
MLEKPDVPDETLRACLRELYGLHGTHLVFLPIGNDVNTAVYRVVADAGAPYFLKLRSGVFDATTVIIPRLLHDRGITHVIPPIPTRGGHLWARMEPFALILFPFITGQNGFAVPLSERQWIELGVALRGVHATVVPPSLRAAIPREHYTPLWRNRVRMFQARIEETAVPDPIAAASAAFLRARRDEISSLVARAEALGAALRARPPASVLCHADIHAANVLTDANGALFIVDWDTLVFAPKERDLMFIGGGVGGVWNSAEEEALFYQGYGRTEIDPLALAYYRYERIVVDLAEYCAQLLLTDEGGADRARGLGQLRDQFLPNNVVAIARRTDASLGARV